jgi:site-specific DNA-methyltransferase (adenine-specific)
MMQKTLFENENLIEPLNPAFCIGAVSRSTLLFGDCLVEMDKIESGSVDAIITDPPYGTTQCKWDSIIPFDLMWKQLNRVIKPNGVIILFSGEPFTSTLICSNIENFKYRLNWNKMQGSGFLNSKKRPLTMIEDICVFSNVKLGNSTYNPQLTDKEKHKIRPIGNRKPCDVTTYGKHNSQLSEDYDNTKSHPTDLISESSKQAECNSVNRVHPTQKPVSLIEWLVKTYTNKNETVLDFTMGSGSTGVACKNTNRNFIGIEKDENYYNIAVRRCS